MTIIVLAAGLFVYYQSTLPKRTVLALQPIQPDIRKGLELEDEESKYRNNLERMQREIEMIMDPVTKEVPIERLLAAKKIASQRFSTPQRSGIDEIDWEERGPDNVGGRTRAILIDAADPSNNTVFAGGVAGGLWRTTNFQSSSPKWTKLDDFYENIAISSIVQDREDSSIIYFGTGECWGNIDGVRGLGIWKSTDGGRTFNQLASTNDRIFYCVYDLEIDLQGALYASTVSGGVQRSEDGGASWTQVLGLNVEAGATNRAADLEVASNGDLYATLGVFSAGSVWKSSTNKGEFVGKKGHWKDVTPEGGNYWRMELATAPSMPRRVFVVAQEAENNGVGFVFRSDDAGDRWTALPVPTIYDFGRNPEFTRGQAWYDLIAAVHPEHPDEVYLGGVDAVRSFDAGETWEQISNWHALLGPAPGLTRAQYVHADHHEILFVPGTWGKEAIWGTDGGIFLAKNLQYKDRKPTFTSKNTGYNVTQFYGVAVHPNQGSNYFLGGTQDNGTQQFKEAGMNSTVEATGGDGGFCHIDQSDPNVQVTSFTGNTFAFSLNGGKSFEFVASFPGGSFINPSEYDNDARKIYSRFGDGAMLRWNDPAEAGLSFNLVRGLDGSITHIMADPHTDDRIWTGLLGERTSIALIDDAGGDAPVVTNLKPPAEIFPFTTISSIAVDENDPSHLLVTLSNYGIISVWEVRNADSSPRWTAVEGNLPDMPVRWGMFVPGRSDQALIATELGVWSTKSLNGDATNWNPTNRGLANTRVDMLQLRVSDGLIAAATHGRGLFTTGGVEATCDDGVQNGNETGVDCGGSCGPCDEYCTAGPGSAHFEWIERVSIAGLENISGNDGGYGDYTDLIIKLKPGESVFFELEPNIELSGFPQYVTVWIDYNKDKDFDDPGETVFRANTGTLNILRHYFKVPEDANGVTRMRITQEDRAGGPPAGPCDGYPYGETEDYTVYFDNCRAPENVSCTGLFGNTIIFRWDAVSDATEYELQYKINNEDDWTTVTTSDTRYRLLVSSGSLITYRMRSICPLGTSNYSLVKQFRFGQETSSPNIGEGLGNEFNLIHRVYPNPIHEILNIEYTLTSEQAELVVFDASGKQVYRRNLATTFGLGRTQINTANWPSGNYLLNLKAGKENITKQIVKQ